METYRLSASALLRLVAIASVSPAANAAELLNIVQSAQPEGIGVTDAPDSADKPAKPE